jgi:hypothetical protein
MENAWQMVIHDRGLKMGLLAGGSMLVLASGEHLWWRALGLGMILGAWWCPP